MSFIGEWLLIIVEPYLVPGQCGLRGSSITHYLVQFLHFVFPTLDMRKLHAVLAAFVYLKGCTKTKLTLLNFSAYKHAEGFGHNSFER